MKKGMYLTLYHGRETATEEMDEGGFLGPLIGPVCVSLTYGNIKIHSTDWNDFAWLPMAGDCIRMPEGFFGDMEVIHSTDSIVKDKGDRRVYSWEEFSRYAQFPDQVKQFIKQRYGLELSDMDLDDESIWTVAAGESVSGEQYVEEFAEKLDLTRND